MSRVFDGGSQRKRRPDRMLSQNWVRSPAVRGTAHAAPHYSPGHRRLQARRDSVQQSKPLWHNVPPNEHGSAGGLTPRLGAILNYKPAMVLYVSQPFDDSIKVIDLAVGGPAGSEIFVPTTSRVIRSAALNHPVDLAPVRIETEDPNWASNTTMEEGTDFYVCNRGNSSVVRMRQDGSVVAARRVRFDGRSLAGRWWIEEETPGGAVRTEGEFELRRVPAPLPRDAGEKPSG